MQLLVILALLSLSTATRFRNVTTQVTLKAEANGSKQVPTFEAYYNQHVGRGMWKWNVALDAYQRHFAGFASKQSKMLEIGVQSGGSINMYHSVLPMTFYYGMDINNNCVAFQTAEPANTFIYIGDQASVPVWTHFFQAISPALDMCIDDGGHQAHQMLATIQQVLPHMNPGGFFLTEDIHAINDDYLHKFFQPAAHAITTFQSLVGAWVHSVHLYNFVLGVQMNPTAGQWLYQAPAAVATATEFAGLLALLPQHLGATVELRNPAWGSFFNANGLMNFFQNFYEMHGGVVREEPVECHDGMASNCAMIATNTAQQNLVKAVHIYADHALVEVLAAPPAIRADRKGSQWIPYNGP